MKDGYQAQSESGKERWPEGCPPDLMSERTYTPGSHGQADGQISNLRDKPISITSPPYDAKAHPSIGSVNKDGWGISGKDIVARRGLDGTCEIPGETYLSAMRQVYAEIAKVSDVCVVITKNPTRNHALRRLDLDTVALLKEAGFSILCTHKALLFEKTEVTDLFGRTHKKVKGRMSFFKRLSWQKGSPVAAWEDVIFAVKNPSAALRINSGKMVTLSSPPYSDQDGKSLTRRNTQVVKNSYVVPDEKPRQDGYGSTPGQIGKLK